MDQQLFREQAVRRLASPEQTDIQLRITPPRTWLGLAGVFLLIMALSYWAVVGELYRKVDGDGLLLGQDKIEEAVLYVSMEEGKKIKPGMAVHLFPDAYTKGEYDYILAIVKEVSLYPVDQEKMVASQHGHEVATRLIAKVGQAPFEVMVKLQEMLPEIEKEFSPGTPCTAMIITGKAHPVELVFPGVAPGF